MGSGDFSIGSEVWPGLSKLIEECGELLQVAGKLMGTAGEVDHWDGTNLRDRLMDEIADVRAAIKFVDLMHWTGVERMAMHKREFEKLSLFCRWQGEQTKVKVCPMCVVKRHSECLGDEVGCECQAEVHNAEVVFEGREVFEEGPSA
jgi:hypothetical protein